MGSGATSRGNGDELHVDALRAYGFGGDSDGVFEALFAGESFSCLKQAACCGG